MDIISREDVDVGVVDITAASVRPGDFLLLPSVNGSTVRTFCIASAELVGDDMIFHTDLGKELITSAQNLVTVLLVHES